MQGSSSSFPKLIAILLFATIAAALLLHLTAPKPPSPVATPATVATAPTASTTHYTAPAVPHPSAPVPEETNSESDIPNCPLTRAQIEAWLTHHNRDARSLLAAFRTSHDTNYLNEAATNFPGDAGVQLSVLAHDEFPADRRKWLDAFKTSSPSNSLANYLSAQDYFKNGQTDQAVQELLAASGKTQFDNHAIANILDAGDMYSESGIPSLMAHSYQMSDMADEDLPELSIVRQLDNAMSDLMKQKNAAGDSTSAANVAQMGIQMANDLGSGDSGKFIVNDLVARASENVFVSQLDPNTAYDFLNGQTPADVLDQLKADKAAFKQLHQTFQPILMGMYQDPAEMNQYMQRSLIYGETAAMKWAIQQYGPPPSPTPGQ